MKTWRILAASLVALILVMAVSGAALANGDDKSNAIEVGTTIAVERDKDVPTDPAAYHAYLYDELTDHGGKDFIRHIPSFSSNEFRTALKAYEFVIRLALGGYADDLIQWGQEDYWADSRQTHRALKGDCEDWAIYLASLLLYHTRGKIDAYVAVGQLTWPSTIAPGAGGSPTAPPQYSGGHAWVVIPAPEMPGVPADSWIILDPVYFGVAASEFICVPYFDPTYGQTFYVSPGGAYLEAFRFNAKTASGFLESLLMG